MSMNLRVQAVNLILLRNTKTSYKMNIYDPSSHNVLSTQSAMSLQCVALTLKYRLSNGIDLKTNRT